MFRYARAGEDGLWLSEMRAVVGGLNKECRAMVGGLNKSVWWSSD